MLKIEFTDEETFDSWVEEYESLEEIKDEILDGVTWKFVFECFGCKTEVRTKSVSENVIGLCPDCSNGIDEHIERGDLDDGKDRS